MRRYVLDTDHLSLHQRGHEPLKSYLQKISPEQIGITIISVEELFRGRLAQVRRAQQPEERLKAYFWLSRTLDYLWGFEVLKNDPRAEAYFQKLRAQKIRIGIQDLKIAAIVLSHDATLVTRNVNDFKNIPSLKIEDWSR
jgi:tRNA(fMet)-specific endonuclease VapC